MKNGQLILATLLTLAFCASCRDSVANLTTPQRQIIERYFSKRDLRQCDIEVERMQYFSDLKGIFAQAPGPGFDEVSMTYLDENTDGIHFSEEFGTPTFYPFQSILRSDPIGKDFVKRGGLSLKDAKPHEMMVNVSGWVVDGNVSCQNPYHKRRFILLDGYGQPQSAAADQ